MAGKKGKGGQKERSGGVRKGSGPKPKRYPNFLAPLETKIESGTYPNNEVDGHIDHIQLGGCESCGVKWWSDYIIDVRLPFNPIQNSLGDHFYLIDRIKVEGSPEQHRDGCCYAIANERYEADFILSVESSRKIQNHFAKTEEVKAKI